MKLLAATLLFILLARAPARASILPETSPKHAVRLAELADASYLPADKLDAVLTSRGYERLHVVDRTVDAGDAEKMARSTFLFTAKATGRAAEVPAGSLAIVIRGSHSVNDWYTNAHARLKEWTADGKAGAGRIHTGFLAVASVALASPEVMAQVKAAPRIYLAGHSLGGAAAVIVAAHLVEQGIPAAKLQVFTYGAPMPGDAAFAKHYARILDFYEYRNSKDPFFVLPSSLFFRHLCDERAERFIQLKREQWSINDHVTNFSDHHMWNYVYRMHGEDKDILCARFALKPEDVTIPFALPQRIPPALKKMGATARELSGRLRKMLQ